MNIDIKVTTIDFQRNGVAGTGFYVVHFRYADKLDPPYLECPPPVGSCYAQRHEDLAACGLPRGHEGPHSWEGHEPARNMMAVVFPPDAIEGAGPGEGSPDWGRIAAGNWDNPRVAVFAEALLPDTSFDTRLRGDYFAPALYEAISEWEFRGRDKGLT